MVRQKPKFFNGIAIVLKYIRPHKRSMIILAVLSILSAFANAAAPFFSGRIIDAIVTPGSMSIPLIGITRAVFVYVGLWFLVRASSDVIDWQFDTRNTVLGAKLESSYLVEGYSTLLMLPVAFHKSHKMGDVQNRISRAANCLDALVRQVIVRLLPQFLSIFAALIFVFWIQPLLASILLTGVVVYACILFFVVPRIAEIAHASHKAFGLAYGDAYDATMNVTSVKQAVAEEYEKKKLARNFFKRAFRYWLEMRELWEMISIWQRSLIVLVQFLIFVISVFLIDQGKLTLGELAMFNGYAGMFFGPFITLGHNWEVIQNGMVTLERAEKHLAQPREVYMVSDPLPDQTIRGAVEFRDVYFRYEKKQDMTLNGITFSVPMGAKVAMVGESGGGKSTLIDLISRYFFPTKGEILIDGNDIGRYNLAKLRGQIALVPQEILLFNDTVKNNIRYGSFHVSDDEVQAAAHQAHAEEFIERFPKKYNQIVGERGIKLSMGQKQRIAIARAVLRDPKILILDEPTSALDAKSERYIQESFQELMKGRTTFIIAHRLSTVREADLILVLDGGTIAEQGTHQELMAKENGVYRRLYELQIGLS
jgi:ABC-type multidrug transport system fused ATPase/permease subunit